MSSGHRFKDGPWEGYLTIGGASNNRKKISLNLKFKDEVDGQGIMDDLGPFELTGVCGGKSPYPCDLKLRFSNIEFVFSGYREGEKNGMFGTWKSSKKVTEWNHATSGSFSLQPSTEPVADLGNKRTLLLFFLLLNFFLLTRRPTPYHLLDKMNIDQLVRQFSLTTPLRVL